MLLCKANPELKAIFTALIKKMNVQVSWNSIFAITNDYLILVGEVRSLIFNYADKKVITNILDFPLDNQEIKELSEDGMITNIFNMTLYAFSKWGSIEGVKVDKDYGALNKLFRNILKEIQIEPDFRDTNYRFYQNGVRITYEEVILEALKILNKDEDKDNDNKENSLDAQDENSLGLWHNMKWKIKNISFEKEDITTEDREKSRIGSNFYLVNYICHDCKENIFMTNFPDNNEMIIDTEKGHIVLARMYTCHTCKSFFTPTPGKLLAEGEVFSIEFDDDEVAYKDYLEHLGNKGCKTPTYRLNEYVADIKDKTEQDNSNNKDEEIMDEVDESISDHANIKDKKKMNKRKEKGNLKEKDKKNTKNEKTNINSDNKNGFNIFNKIKAAPNGKYDYSDKKDEELESIIKEIENKNHKLDSNKIKDLIKDPKYISAKSQLEMNLKTKYEKHIKELDSMTSKQLAELKNQIENEKRIVKEDAIKYIDDIDKAILKRKEKVNDLNQQEQISISPKNNVKDSSNSDLITGEKNKKAEIKGDDRKEIDKFIKGIPLQIKSSQYDAYIEKLNQFKNVDIMPYKKLLEEKKDMAEKEEISSYVKRVNKKDRQALNELYEQLKTQNFTKQNLNPYLEKVYDRIREIDEAKIASICPDISDALFEEGLEAYKKINELTILPELKTNTLDSIRRRLMKIKTDENLQLVRKLKRELENNIKDFSKIYFYEARRFQGQDNEKQDEDDYEAICNALNTYGIGRGEYEYPILICDTTRAGNGKKGFILTPDHIFYKDFYDFGKINIAEIKELEYVEGKFKKGLFVNRISEQRQRIPNSLKKNIRNHFINVINEFITYLKEKPESRNIEYLAKERHIVKCCFRCGYTYKGGNICPKCGSKANR